MENRLVIISNRLPVKYEKDKDGQLKLKNSEGGLATALNSLENEFQEKHWIGWPGACFEHNIQDKKEVEGELKKQNLHPIFLSEDQKENYYEGFCNETIWPLFHYFNVYSHFQKENWDSYLEVNRMFCEKASEIIKPGDTVWIQDYHLMLLPEMLRERFPDIEIGFFLHTPFPSYELFRTLPCRKELLHGILGADLVGFHTSEYMRHFLSTTSRILDYDAHLGEIQMGMNSATVDSFPIGINFEKFHDAVGTPEVKNKVEQFRKSFGNGKMILSVDRLDYSKGILHRLEAYEKFLQDNPEYHEKASLMMVVVPSRENVNQYYQLKEEIDEMVGKINGRHGTLNWTPVQYLYRSVPFEELVALYRLADVALITPLRDGMNLVAKEYVAARDNQQGVLVLSEMAGASLELNDALMINPTDTVETAYTIRRALDMSEEEQKERMTSLQKVVKSQNVQKWSGNFLKALKKASGKNGEIRKNLMNGKETRDIKAAFKSSNENLIVLDYDGTLVPFHDDPKRANPGANVLRALKNLAENNTVVIVSGRDHFTLEQWFGKIDVDLIAEHGSWHKVNGKWKQVKELNDNWKYVIREKLEEFQDKTSGSFVEEKIYSLAWHYRKSDKWLGEMRVRQLLNEIIYPCSKMELEILDGNKVLEIGVKGINKGTAAYNWIQQKDWDFILGVGDDITDEDLFKVLPEHAYSLKVGCEPTEAKYRVSSCHSVVRLLNELGKISAEKQKHQTTHRKSMKYAS